MKGVFRNGAFSFAPVISGFKKETLGHTTLSAAPTMTSTSTAAAHRPRAPSRARIAPPIATSVRKPAMPNSHEPVSGCEVSDSHMHSDAITSATRPPAIARSTAASPHNNIAQPNADGYATIHGKVSTLVSEE